MGTCSDRPPGISRLRGPDTPPGLGRRRGRKKTLQTLAAAESKRPGARALSCNTLAKAQGCWGQGGIRGWAVLEGLQGGGACAESHGMGGLGTQQALRSQMFWRRWRWRGTGLTEAELPPVVHHSPSQQQGFGGLRLCTISSSPGARIWGFQMSLGTTSPWWLSAWTRFTQTPWLVDPAEQKGLSPRGSSRKSVNQLPPKGAT